MIINHNIAALNTYRQLSNNNVMSNKSLERLSSGLRINRAGDDAAGLAISEKMRAQIRGLDQAVRNAQDGISMIQTAEGALNETHSILQRMRELANQAANDTNVDVDRAEIQKEINQLTSEINRIGNATEFNTQKLLNGGTIKTTVTTNTKGVALAQGEAAVNVDTSSVKAIGFLAKVGTESTAAVGAKYTVEVVTGDTITIDAGVENGAAANSLKIVFAAGGADVNASAALAGDTLTITLGINAANNEAAKIQAAIQAEDLSSLGIDETKITVTGDDVAAVPAGGANLEAAAKAAAALTGGKTEVAGVYNFELTADFLETLKDGDTITIAGETFTAKDGAADDSAGEFNIDAASIKNTLDSIKAAVDHANAALVGAGNRFTSSITNGDTTLTLTENAGEATGADLVDATVAVDQTAGRYTIEITKMFKAGEQITFGGETFKAVASGATAANGQFNVGTSVDSQAEGLKAAVEAKLGNRFTVTLEDNKLTLVEKTLQATGEDLAITKIGNVEGTVSFKHVNQSDKGTAAAWSTGALTALADGDTGTITFAGFTINITAADDATTGGDDSAAANKTATSIDLTIDTAALATAEDQAAKIAELLEANKADTALADFAFGSLGDAITITDITADGTGIATNGDNNNGLIIGFTGDVAIANTTSATQLTTVGKDAVKARYTFDITNAFKANETIEIGNMTFKGVAGDANALLGEFSVDGSKANQAASLKAAIEANTILSNRYEVTVADAKVTLTEKVEGQETVALTAPTTELTKGTAGVYSFNAQTVSAGQAYNIDGVSINVVKDADKYRDEIAAGTAMMLADNINDQAENLRSAINANAILSAKYTATGSGSSVKLTQQEGAESSAEPTVSIGSQGADGKFIANFQIGANTGQSMTIEVADMRSVALKVSGSESGVSVTAKNGKEASYVTAANVSNGTDNASVEYALDVSDHNKASAAVSVINDAIETVSAQRSQLGAYQNRLEHTINNLGTSSENMSAAESRIRDVDMAKEIMEFTKMNILSQAAQAMLAQANQQPQGVLQLLR